MLGMLVMVCGVAIDAGADADWSLRLDGAAGVEGAVAVRGVAAGDFRPEWWEAGTLNWVFDSRAPVLEPREGPCRNIYAPMAVRDGDIWRIYYGAWDGTPTGNDRIYTAWTRSFLTFEDRHMVIDHGVFTHVCNCCAIRLPSGEYRMMCTAYPHQGATGLNRPIAFTSPDGLVWNGGAPHEAGLGDLVSMAGYDGWDRADANGMNAILYEDGVYRLYFGDFANFGKVYRATSRDFRTFELDGVALEQALAVNDVRRIDLDSGPWYLMALHMNRDHLYYSLSRDGLRFGAVHTLTANESDADRYIVAVGIVQDGRRVLGVLYGAGAVPTLDHNRLFAKWLQKRVVFRAVGGAEYAAERGLGPDIAVIRLPDGAAKGRFLVYAEDGVTRLHESGEVEIRPAQTWLFGTSR